MPLQSKVPNYYVLVVQKGMTLLLIYICPIQRKMLFVLDSGSDRGFVLKLSVESGVDQMLSAQCPTTLQ